MTVPSFEARLAMQRLAEKECRISGDLYDRPRLPDGRHDLSRVEEKYMECAERLSKERDDEKFRLAQSILTNLAWNESGDLSKRKRATDLFVQNIVDWKNSKAKTADLCLGAAGAMLGVGGFLTLRYGLLGAIAGMAAAALAGGLTHEAIKIQDQEPPKAVDFDYGYYFYPNFEKYFEGLPKSPPVSPRDYLEFMTAAEIENIKQAMSKDSSEPKSVSDVADW